MKKRILLVFLVLIISMILVGCTNREKQPNVNINIIVSPTEGGTVSQNYPDFKLNDGVILTAVAKDGYIFKSWEVDGEVIDQTSNVYKFRALKDQTIKAIFVESYSLDIIIDPDEGGKVEAEKAYEKNTEVTIVAKPTYGYNFIKWVDEDGNDVSRETKYTFTISENRTLRAVFEKKPASETSQIITFVIIVFLISGGVALTIALKKKREKKGNQTPNV